LLQARQTPQPASRGGSDGNAQTPSERPAPTPSQGRGRLIDIVV